MAHSIGIDLGGTKIEGILMDESGQVLKRIRKPTLADRKRQDTLSNLFSIIDELSGQHVGIGIGTPGFCVDGKLELIKNVPSLMGYNLKKEVEKRTAKKVCIENDGNCFALAEHRYGAGIGTRDMVGLIIGTGVGGGIIAKNALYTGFGNTAAEFGHMVIVKDGEKCTCGKNGHLEAYCSGPSIEKRYFKSTGKRMIVKNIFSSKQRAAKTVIEETIQYLAMGLSSIIASLSPEIIVIGGGVSNSPFYAELRREVKRISYPALYGKVRIQKNLLGDSSGVIGAASLVFAHRSEI